MPPNVKGLIAMTHGNGNTIIAYPVSSISGDVQIFDATEKVTKLHQILVNYCNLIAYKVFFFF